MSQPTLVLSPQQAAVPAQGGILDILVRVQAPAQPANTITPPTPKRLALVVDRSGSMDGQPLEEALNCVAHIAKHLTPQDQLSLIVYDDNVNVLLPMQPMRSISLVEQALRGVRSGGSTDLHAGWLAGAQQLVGGTDQAISRVILLSDGQANHGETRQIEIEAQCRQWLARGVSTTTVGLGRGFNEDLMIGMARAGGGQNYYGQTAADLYDSFDEELALLQAMYLRQIDLKLIPAQGVIVEMLSPIAAQANSSYRMTDLAWGAESWLAVRLHVSPSAAGSLRDLLAASVSGCDMEGTTVHAHAPLLQLPALDAAALAALPRDAQVADRLLELEFAKASEHLRKLAEQGDIQATRRALTALEERFGHHPWLSAKMAQLRRLAEEDVMVMAKEASYSAMRMSRRLTSVNEMRFVADETENTMPSYLRKKVSEGRGRQKPNEPQ